MPKQCMTLVVLWHGDENRTIGDHNATVRGVMSLGKSIAIFKVKLDSAVQTNTSYQRRLIKYRAAYLICLCNWLQRFVRCKYADRDLDKGCFPQNDWFTQCYNLTSSIIYTKLYKAFISPIKTEHFRGECYQMYSLLPKLRLVGHHILCRCKM